RLASVRHRAGGARHVLHRPPRGGVAPRRLHPRRGRPSGALPRPRGARRDGVFTQPLLQHRRIQDVGKTDMKSPRLTRVFLVAALAAALPPAVALLAGCTHKGADTAAAKKYQCPMHPQIIRDKPGECPICGMKLVPIEAVTHAEGAAAEGTTRRSAGSARRILVYRSPMNPSETSPVPKKDSMGMDFVPDG